VACREAAYDCPAVPWGSELVLTTSGGAATVSVSVLVAVCGVAAESFTCTVKDEDPALDGVPLIAPLEAFKLSPAGSEPEARLQL
jgi:hypothetical protein